LRDAMSMLVAQTLTPNAVISVERLLAGVLQSASVTPDMVPLLLAVVTGLARVSATGRKPGVSATGRKPGVSATGRKPGVTIE